MTRRVLISAAGLLAAGVAGCDCGGTQLGRYGVMTLTITSPMQGQAFGTTDNIDFSANVKDVAGVQDLELQIGNDKLKLCNVGGDASTITCDSSFQPKGRPAAELVRGSYTLTAIAHDRKGNVAKQQLTINVQSLKVTFAAPALTQQTPPIAEVSGTSDLTVKVDSAAPLKSVVVTYDANKPLASWMMPSSTMTAFAQSEQWTSALGTGAHTLTAQATDVNNQVGTAKLSVLVKCTADSDCSTDQRCCTVSGNCNSIVAPGADCDCDHPCPADQGCFPGTCGQTPMKCRPGCDPGDETHSPQACTAQENGEPAWCSPLPAEQATNQNKGGACAPGDSCDVVKQDCPDLPLDRSKPVGPGNPLVPYTCVPASAGPPAVNQCKPAGAARPCNGNMASCDSCSDSCDNNSTNCTKGYQCIQQVTQCSPGSPGCQCAGSTCYAAVGNPNCLAQCSDPWVPDPNNPFSTPPPAPDCPSGFYCGGVLGNGYVTFPTGVCSPLF